MSRMRPNQPIRHYLLWGIFTGLILQSSLLVAQQPDSSWQREQIAQATALYNTQFSGPNSPVYHGYQYVPFILPATGDPFYPTAQWHSGSVFFKGKPYTGLSLLYDVLKDQLVLKSANGLYRILLDAKDVDWFTLDSLRFIHIPQDDAKRKDLPPPGYYEQRVDGNPVALLVKREKSVEEPVSAGQPRRFRAKSVYYIKNADRYYKVRTKHAVLKALKDQRRTIRQYLRKHRLYFNQQRERAIEQAVHVYNKTKHNAS